MDNYVAGLGIGIAAAVLIAAIVKSHTAWAPR